MYVWRSRSASSAAYCSVRLVSALNGMSTDVDTFSRSTVRPSISLRTESSTTSERAKIRLVRPLPSRMRPSNRCSVSMDTLPSWLASYRAKNRTRRALSV